MKMNFNIKKCSFLLYICSLLALGGLSSCKNTFFPDKDKDSDGFTAIVIPRVLEVDALHGKTMNDSAAKLEMLEVRFKNASSDRIVLGEELSEERRTETVAPFRLSKYEVSYNLWYEVYQWALKHGYEFENKGAEGSYSNDTSQTFFNEGGSPKDKGIPVTGLSWRDCMVFCNAISEFAGLKPVYYSNSSLTKPVRSSKYEGEHAKKVTNCPLPYGNANETDLYSLQKGAVDNPYVNTSANGFRLPYNREFEYASRKMNDGSFLSGNAIPGDTSGIIASSEERPLWQQLEGKTDKLTLSKSEWKKYAWTMENFGDACVEKTAAGWNDKDTSLNGKGKYRMHKQGSKLASGLGFYDLGGNAYEWVFDFGASYSKTNVTCSVTRFLRSSSFSISRCYATSGHTYTYFPYIKMSGLRLAQNVQ